MKERNVLSENEGTIKRRDKTPSDGLLVQSKTEKLCDFNRLLKPHQLFFDLEHYNNIQQHSRYIGKFIETIITKENS